MITFLIGVFVTIYFVSSTNDWHLLIGPVAVGLFTLKYLLPKLDRVEK